MARYTAWFWDIETSSQSDGCWLGFFQWCNGVGYRRDDTLSTFTDVGWDFSETDGDPADWMMLREGEDYPRLHGRRSTPAILQVSMVWI
jgi:hypothetical protein